MTLSSAEKGLLATGKLAFSIDEWCEALGGAMGRTAVYEAIKDGRLKARKIGTRTAILAEDGIEFLRNLPKLEAA